MEFFKKLLEILGKSMEKPTLFGWFHILFIVLSIAAGVLLCVFHNSEKPDRVRKVVLWIAVAVMVLEVFKQIYFSFSTEWGELKFTYQWYVFPFQFCSTPMYVGLLAGLIRRGKVHDSLMAYLATYAMFAGICVMAYPGDVFTYTAFLNYQTMICHGSMLTVGIYLFGSGYVKLEHKTVLRALPVFAIAVLMAVCGNELVYRSGILTEGQVFNMFYVSPHFVAYLPVYSAVQRAVPYPWCLFIYIAGFTLAAYIILLGAMGIRRLADLIKTKIILKGK